MAKHSYEIRVLNTLISDSGLQFDSKAFWRYCCDFGIKNRYSTPAYPQGNGQAGTMKKIIIDGLKKRLEENKVDELPHVLWVYRIMPRKSTPLSITYDFEASIPLETGFPTLRTNQFDNSNNEKLLSNNLDFSWRAKGSRCRQVGAISAEMKVRVLEGCKNKNICTRGPHHKKGGWEYEEFCSGKLIPTWKEPYWVT